MRSTLIMRLCSISRPRDGNPFTLGSFWTGEASSGSDLSLKDAASDSKGLRCSDDQERHCDHCCFLPCSWLSDRVCNYMIILTKDMNSVTAFLSKSEPMITTTIVPEV